MVVKLIAAYAVGGIVVGKFPYGAVIFAQPVLCACPYIALCIFLNARDVPAGCTLYGLDFSGGGRIVQQSVADGSNPYISTTVFEDVGRDEYYSASGLITALCAGLQSVERLPAVGRRQHDSGSGGLYRQQQPSPHWQHDLSFVLHAQMRLGL